MTGEKVIIRYTNEAKTRMGVESPHPDLDDKIEIIKSTNLHSVVILKDIDLEDVIDQLNTNPNVKYVEPDITMVGTVAVVPTDALFANYQWALRNTGQRGGTPGCDIDATLAWQFTTGSRDVDVAVVDSGVKYDHPDLTGNCQVGVDFINDDYDAMDDNGHGTHVAGIIGALGNTVDGIAGINWLVNIIPIKVLNASNEGTLTDVLYAVDYVNNAGIPIVNLSLGADTYVQSLRDAINSSSALYICGAGNNGTSAPFYPAAYDCANIIAVANSDGDDNLNSGSSYGSYVDLAAPGTDIVSTYNDGNYVSMSGTSMATPHVTGVAALLKAYNASLTTSQIRTAILSSVDIIAGLSGKVATSGRLNAYKALLAVGASEDSEDDPIEEESDDIIQTFQRTNLTQGAYSELLEKNISYSHNFLIHDTTNHTLRLGSTNKRFNTLPIIDLQ